MTARPPVGEIHGCSAPRGSPSTWMRGRSAGEQQGKRNEEPGPPAP